MTVSLPLPLRKTAASSPMPEMSDLFASDEDAARCRSVFIKSNSLLSESIGPRGCSCSSFILKDFDEANQGLPQLFQSEARMRNANDFRRARRKRFPELSRPERDSTRPPLLRDCLC